MSERVVTLNEVEDRGEAGERLGKEKVIEGINKAVVAFTKVEDYTTFVAEFGVKDGDLIFHFYLTPELDEQPKDGPVAVYWMSRFPRVLDGTAQDFFKTGPPRLQAKYTQEMQSWWLRAQGFGENLEPDKLAYAFLETLDRDLDTSQSQAC